MPIALAVTFDTEADLPKAPKTHRSPDVQYGSFGKGQFAVFTRYSLRLYKFTI
jgi:hypothetical protein